MKWHNERTNYFSRSARYAMEVLKKSGSSFAASLLMVPEPKRSALAVYYAFCREVDDLADGDLSIQQKREALHHWQHRLENLNDNTHPLMPAIRHITESMKIPVRYFELVLDGVRSDLDTTRYQTFEQLYDYCYKVASAVGMFVVELFGVHDEKTLQYAETAGVAVQLTNILRDVAEDLRRGRVYLPAEDMEKFGIDKHTLETAASNEDALEAASKLIMFEARRAKMLYEMAYSLLPKEMERNLYLSSALVETYYQLLDEIMNRKGDVFTHRVSVPTSKKLSIALRHRAKSIVPGI